MRMKTHFAKSLCKLPTLVGITAATLALAGCAQTSQPGYYNPPPASSTQDAIQFAEGGVTKQTLTAPSQIQIKLRPGPSDQSSQAQPTQVAQVSPADGLTPAGQAELQKEIQQDEAPGQNALIPQPETFFGTLPCFHRDMRCTAHVNACAKWSLASTGHLPREPASQWQGPNHARLLARHAAAPASNLADGCKQECAC